MNQLKIYNAAVYYLNAFRRDSSKILENYLSVFSSKPLLSYIGWTGYNNLGDEVLFLAHKKLFPSFSLIPFRRNRLISKFYIHKSKDSFYAGGILGGGTLINQSSKWSDQISYLQSRNISIFCIGTGVTEETFKQKHENVNVEEWAIVLKQFLFIGVRGPRSQKLLKEAGIESVIVGDTALALAPDHYTHSINSRIIGYNFGITENSQIWGDTERYFDETVKSIKKLIGLGYKVHLLPVWSEDVSSNLRLEKAVGNKDCIVITKFKNYEKYIEEIQKCSLFIGQKLHSTIIATMYRVPSIMLEYQPKCLDYMESIGMEKYIIKTSKLSSTLIVKLVNEMEENRASIQTKLDKNILFYKKKQTELATKIERQLIS